MAAAFATASVRSTATVARRGSDAVVLGNLCYPDYWD
jgi:hypothetical protein